MKRKVLEINSSPESSSSADAHQNASNDQSAKTPTASTGQQSSRRGHFKSRLGCFNCKRRRVKCNELRPSCSPCHRLGLLCEYPNTAASSVTIRANPSALALQDLQFYHRFLTTAFPTLPLRDDKVWAKCAAMSHQVSVFELLAPSHMHSHRGVVYADNMVSVRMSGPCRSGSWGFSFDTAWQCRLYLPGFESPSHRHQNDE